jgi:hypothetical protein
VIRYALWPLDTPVPHTAGLSWGPSDKQDNSVGIFSPYHSLTCGASHLPCGSALWRSHSLQGHRARAK